MKKLGITIIGYKNAKGIKRLLSSLDNACISDDNVLLIFSIDYSGNCEVEEIARKYEWKHGKKLVLAYENNLGLKAHILKCGSYLEEYSLDAMAVLEDDIYVSPDFYNYMKSAVEYYNDNPQIAGISLYKHEYNLYAKHPFTEYDDGGDVFFMQYAMSWGQVWMRDQWKDFIQWYESEGWKQIDVHKVPENVLRWDKSWLKYHIMYCIDKNKFFVYPKRSLSTNFTDPGTHNRLSNTAMQVSLNYRKNDVWKFTDINETMAVYDAFFENMCLSRALDKLGLVIDLYGTKHYCESDRYVLTRRVLPFDVIQTWGLSLRPIEANVFSNIEGEGIFLYDLKRRSTKKISGAQKEKIFEYDLKGIDTVNITCIKFTVKEILRILSIKLKKKR